MRAYIDVGAVGDAGDWIESAETRVSAVGGDASCAAQLTESGGDGTSGREKLMWLLRTSGTGWWRSEFRHHG